MLYFFDEASGAWLPMPLSWERHVPQISNMITDIQVQGFIFCEFSCQLVSTDLLKWGHAASMLKKRFIL